MKPSMGAWLDKPAKGYHKHWRWFPRAGLTLAFGGHVSSVVFLPAEWLDSRWRSVVANYLRQLRFHSRHSTPVTVEGKDKE